MRGPRGSRRWRRSTGDKATIGPDGLAVAPASAPPEVAEIIAAGNEIATKPYKYGGGHGSWRDSGYDCSGSVSYALHGAGLLDTQLDSSALAGFGKRGRGSGSRSWATPDTPTWWWPACASTRAAASAPATAGRRAMRSSRGYAVRHPAGL